MNVEQVIESVINEKGKLYRDYAVQIFENKVCIFNKNIFSDYKTSTIKKYLKKKINHFKVWAFGDDFGTCYVIEIYLKEK